MDLTNLQTGSETGIAQFKVKTKATVLPVSLEVVKSWLKRTGTTSEDTTITSLIKEAQDLVQNIIGRSLMERVCQYYIPAPGEIVYLPYTASEIISILDEDGNPVTYSTRGLSNKYAVLSDFPTPTHITVEYKSGTPTASELEEAIILALKKLITEAFENRGDSASIDMSNVSQATRLSVAKILYPLKRNILL